jgi:hypothetical protein
VLTAFVELGLPVLVPFGEGQPYDLVVELEDLRFLRVQCKMGWKHNGCLKFNSRSTDHGHGAGTYFGLADLFGIYFPPTKTVYALPVLDMPTSRPHLRLDPTRNNQRLRTRIASDYELDHWTPEGFRAVANAALEFEDGKGQEHHGPRLVVSSP